MQAPPITQPPPETLERLQTPQRDSPQPSLTVILKTPSLRVPPPSSPGTTPQRVHAVVLTSSPVVDRSEYVRFEAHEELQFRKSKAFADARKNRKRRRSISDDDEIGVAIDQRAKAEGSLLSLQNLIDAIFQAEDNLQADTSERYGNHSETTKYFVAGTADPCLSTTIQAKLESSIKKVISVKRFSQIPVDDLIRLLKLCDNALKRTEAENIMPPIDPAESDMEEWLGRIGDVENGLKSAKTVLRIMSAGREEKQIYSEDILASVLTLVKNLIESALNPMIEMRSGSDQNGAFKSALAQKKILGGVMHEVTLVLELLSYMFSNQEATETVINSSLYMVAAIIFVENATNEKDSLFGIQRVEVFRMTAMDIIAKIFARYPDQRSNIIFEQILTNLEKLPVNRATARQFKLLEGGKNIQLISALIMRLVQTAGTYQPKKRKRGITQDENGEIQFEANDDERGYETRNPEETVTTLHHLSSPLMEDAQKTANSIVNYLVQKAMNTTKTGDQPYRHLLDIFTEDFLVVLGYPEWPAAELLLRSLLLSMCTIIDGEKQPVTAKTMALDLLGVMGSGICDMVVHLREGRRAAGNNESGIAALIDKYLEIEGGGGNKANTATALDEELLDWEGPYRVSLEHLFEAKINDNTLQSACGYYLTLWSSKICTLWEKVGEKEHDDDTAIEISRCATQLKAMTLHREWDDDIDMDSFTQSQIRQAYVLTVLNLPFCQLFDRLFNRLLRCMDDNQAQSRSKALKSITQLLGKDPSILNRTQVIPFIMKKSRDASPLVRDSAVDLLGKCISIKPEIEGMVCKTIIDRTIDLGVAVRKRAMKILKDIYLHSKFEHLKIMIAEALVQRIKDNDASVAEQAKRTFEEIWMAPFYTLIGDSEDRDEPPVDITPQLKLVANERVSVIVKVAQKDVMLDVFKSLLHQDNANKNSGKNFRVCQTIVSSMFEDLLDQQAEVDKVVRGGTMQTLTVFAKTDSKLFTPEQLMLLQPYIENLTSDDLHLFRSVIIIYRFSMPQLTSRQNTFLQNVQSSLLKNLTRLPIQEVPEVVSCLWTISGILKAPDRLIRVTISCATNVQRVIGKPIDTPAEIRRVGRTLQILGLFGHYCNFEDHAAAFKTSFPKWAGGSVSGLIVDTTLPFCDPSMPSEVRKAGLESLGRVCQTHAVHFLKPQVLKMYDHVFEESDRELKKLVLEGIKGFLLLEESRSLLGQDEGVDPKGKKGGEVEEPGRLTQAAYANANDGVSTSLAQKYLKDIVGIAMGSQDAYALVATEVIASILRQGLVHPKELVPALVSLESCSLPAINQIAYKEHKTLHGKHETIVERGYMDGVRSCFLYQRDVAGDGAGALATAAGPYSSKLRQLYEIAKEGSKKVKRKLLENMVKSIDFDPVKVNVHKKPTHIEYARFVIGNLAFMDYGTTEEVYQVVTAMEKLVAGTGVAVAHSIETDIFFIKLENGEERQDRTVDPQRLKVLSTGAAILTMVWAARTYIRKAFGINEQKVRDYRHGKIKATDPSLNKAPGRNPNVNQNAVFDQIESTAMKLEDINEMMEQCRQFVEILSVDNEFKLAAEGDDEDDIDFSRMGGNTPELSGDEGAPPIPATPKKRKGSEGADKGAKRRKPAAAKNKRKS
ncbi:sister chromatid cohesion C-terminus-domain-containing protein [Pyronema domesticum]|nr:sister chromatid cohesion C-terminus-domain-containing protein [Pyronema domesticum]